MQLVIVESPTKARTISKFLGKNYVVKSSYGHVRDLPTSTMGVDVEHDFLPHYVISKKAKPRVAELKDLVADSEKVILATDEDREGEAIAWHLAQALNLKKNIRASASRRTKSKEYERIVFHEITKTAIEKALEKPREIDLNLVDAQQGRRILDRLVGYELSPFLWKKVRRGLSAGRVQSVALRFIVEREREIQAFKEEEYWTINVKFSPVENNQDAFEAALSEKNGEKIEQTVTLSLFAGDYKTKKTVITNEQQALDIIEDLKTGKYKVSDIIEKEIRRTPPAPFTTSTLQQTAINSLGFSTKQTMSIAQKLYEEGHITYMRTDSVNLSMESMLAAKKVITQTFGEKYALSDPRFFKNKSKGAQEAHEAIRPTFPNKSPEELKAKLDNNEYRLYRLIWNRMIASQMQPSILKSVRVTIEGETKDNAYLLQTSGSTVIFDGYLKVYSDRNPATEPLIPAIKVGSELSFQEALPNQKSTTSPPRYNEAALVKILEEYGIGRPSTYAPTITTILERKYVDKNEDKKLYPLEIGFLVNDILVEHFSQIVDPTFTAQMEESLDLVAEGQKEWVPIVRSYYDPFHKNIEQKSTEVKKEDVLEKLDRQCPECGGDLIVKFGRFGKFIACINYPTCRYTEKTEEEKNIESQFSGEVCDKCGAPMALKRGKFGIFLGCSNYPNCKNIKKIERTTGINCPKCNQGEIVERKSKRGKLFYGCNRYPECDFALWSKPTGEKCPKCGSLVIFAAKGKVKCSSKTCDYEN